jgi:hypothetical protein
MAEQVNEQYRTTMSIVFWDATPEEAEARAEAIKEAVHEEDRDSVLVTIEYISGGRPNINSLPPAEVVE